MAKDPAFLFYPGDWQGGTSTFSRFLKGCYMDVLIAQFNNGHLSLDEIKTVLGSDFGAAWPTLQKKFITDPKGLLFNEKLDNEITKRKLYSESRRRNREGKTHEPTHDKDMSGHKENENEIVNEIRISLKKENAKIVSRETSDETLHEDEHEPLTPGWFASIFDEQFLEQKAMAYREHDVPDQLRKFQSKVLGAPEEYIYRDTAGMRNAFDYQLRHTDPKKELKNGTPKPKATLEQVRNYGK